MHRQGDAREESFYPTLADMLGEMARAAGKTHIHVTTLPKPTEGGNPDFRLWNGRDRIVGYIEAKHPKEERLDSIEDSEATQALPLDVSQSHPHQLPRVPPVQERRSRRDGSGRSALHTQRSAHGPRPSKIRTNSMHCLIASWTLRCPKHLLPNLLPSSWRNVRVFSAM